MSMSIKVSVCQLSSVIGSFLIQLTLGGAYAYNEFSYYFATENVTQNIQKAQFIFGVGMFGLSSSMGFGGYMETSFNPCLIILTGSFIMNLGLIITSFTYHTLWAIATYGFICGVGAGLIYSVCLAVTSKLFTRFTGLILGVMVSGFSLGPILINLISKYLIDVKDRSKIFIICPMILLGIQWLGVFLIWIALKYSKKILPCNFILCSNENRFIQVSDFVDDHISEVPVINGVTDVEPHKMLVQYHFWILWIVFAMNSFGTILIIQLHRILEIIPCGLSFSQNITSNHNEYLYGNSYCSFFGRIIWGALISFLPPKIVFMFMCFGSSVIYFVSVSFFQTQKKYEIIVSICCGWLSGNFSIIPLFVLKRFGPNHFASNFGIMWTSYSFAGILTSIFLEEMGQHLRMTMNFFGSMSILSFILLFIYREKSGQLGKGIFDNFKFSY